MPPVRRAFRRAGTTGTCSCRSSITTTISTTTASSPTSAPIPRTTSRRCSHSGHCNSSTTRRGARSSSITRPVLNLDFAPTFVEYAGATIPPTHLVNGMSVVPLLAQTPVTWRSDFLNEHWGGQIPDNAQVQNDQYKYTEYYAEPPPIETEL